MLSAFNDVKSTEKMDIWFYYTVYHKITTTCKTNLHKMSLLLVVICMQVE